MSMWSLTMLLVHAGVLIFLLMLWKDTPDRIQRYGVLLPLVVSFGIYAMYYLLALLGFGAPWQIKEFVQHIEHVAVIVFVARLFLADQERRCLPSGFLTSRN